MQSKPRGPLHCHSPSSFKAPSHPAYHQNLAPLLLAGGQVRSAIHHYRRAIQLNPHDTNSKNDLAIILWRMGKWEAALAALCQVVAAQDDHFEGHLNLATVYHSKGQYDLAISHAQRATQLRPTNAMAHRVLGHVLDQSGNSALSLHHRKIALRRGSGLHGIYHPHDTALYKKLSVQLLTRKARSSKEGRQASHAHMDAYRALSGKHVELANSQRTREILEGCSRRDV